MTEDFRAGVGGLRVRVGSRLRARLLRMELPVSVGDEVGYIRYRPVAVLHRRFATWVGGDQVTDPSVHRPGTRHDADVVRHLLSV